MSQRVTFDELYRRSTQYRKWSFTKEELLNKRIQINSKGCAKVDERLNQLKDQIEPNSIEKVTIDEELKLISFHSRRIGMLAKHFNMPSQVRATAISFLRKFYLVNSVMEYHPKLVLLTCLFLAAKSENYFISINSFSKRIPKTTPESILSLEFEILQSLEFTLLTHHPFRPLYGFFFDLQDVLKDEMKPNELGKIYDDARKLIDEALISDAVYHFTPPQIALACLKEINNDIILKYLSKKFKPNKLDTVKEKDEEDDDEQNETIKPTIENELTQSMYEKIVATVEECQKFIRNGENPTKEQATEIDRKVQYCLNPSLILKRKRENTTDINGDSNGIKKQKTDSI
ncbi:hypothetical protein WICMUC_000075 [Wickerhamomyces mucosus]|uniref:Cyclin-like domain-containing protein n=1 Tax=Wickerhamomyces mucosus TaxID=1378264 RepID=A0A9P8PZA8_9ASCO|nr:hypothetical protein WICMUC_000075 [Wickerhamomyces mucosus]